MQPHILVSLIKSRADRVGHGNERLSSRTYGMEHERNNMNHVTSMLDKKIGALVDYGFGIELNCPSLHRAWCQMQSKHAWKTCILTWGDRSRVQAQTMSVDLRARLVVDPTFFPDHGNLSSDLRTLYGVLQAFFLALPASREDQDQPHQVAVFTISIWDKAFLGQQRPGLALWKRQD